tara:strand:- start:223 stop:795 length:573 start_codon:yes stop_codon:yes gene_type:complete
MFGEFLNIILRSIKLDKTLYSDNNNFGEASIYYAIILILLMAIISMVPGSVLYQHMSNVLGVSGILKGPSFRSIIIMSFAVWLVKTAYLYFIGVVMFPSKSTKCNFRKLLVMVAYANAPFIFYILILDITFIYLTFVIYLWYSLTLIIGMKQVLKYENYFKPIVISLTPQCILLIYFLNLASKINNGVIS